MDEDYLYDEGDLDEYGEYDIDDEDEYDDGYDQP